MIHGMDNLWRQTRNDDAKICNRRRTKSTRAWKAKGRNWHYWSPRVKIAKWKLEEALVRPAQQKPKSQEKCNHRRSSHRGGEKYPGFSLPPSLKSPNSASTDGVHMCLGNTSDSPMTIQVTTGIWERWIWGQTAQSQCMTPFHLPISPLPFNFDHCILYSYFQSTH